MHEFGGGRSERDALWTRLARAAVRLRTDALLVVLDAFVLAGSCVVALVLRFDGSVPAHHWQGFVRFLPIALVTAVASNAFFGLYNHVWRHASADEARRMLKAGLVDMVVLLGSELLIARHVPITVIVFGTGLGLFFMALMRFQSRLFSFRRTDQADGLRVVVIGARDAAAALLGEMRRSPKTGWRPVAVVDPDPRFHGRSVMGVRVEGGIIDLPEVALRTGAHLAILAMSSVPHHVVQQAAAAAEEAGIGLKVAPDMGTRISAGISLNDIRDVQIDDLIGRRQVVTDLDAVRAMLAGRRVLVTGAGGSIGSEIARQVAQCGPSTLMLLDHDESHLHDLAATLNAPASLLLADIRNRARVDQLLDRYRPEIVFHAAAHKHVPLLEDHPCEAVMTNVLGTHNLAEACARIGVERVVFISTDKAVQPSNVMGATKRLGEQLTLAHQPEGAHWSAVRFGNVLGSRGSVIPTFLRQIAAGGPVTVTDERMTRYFMSIEEAVQLVLQASVLASGGEVFVLNMGEQVRILDLAQRMIRLSGRRVGTDIEIVISGVRPGEKLVEELSSAEEHEHPTVHPSITRIEPTVLPADLLDGGILELDRLIADLDASAVRAVLFALVGAAVEGFEPPVDIRAGSNGRAPTDLAPRLFD